MECWMWRVSKFSIGCINIRPMWYLWQRDRAKLDTFWLNASVNYSQSHKIALFSHPMGAPGAVQALYIKVLM